MKITVLVAALATLVLSGCSPTSSGVKTGADGNSSGAPSSSKPAGKASAKVGDSITLKGNNAGSKIAVTAIKVVDRVTATDGFSVPDAGKRFVAVQFSIQNTGTTAYDDSPANGAKVVDAQGQQFEADITMSESSAGPGLQASTKLPPGGKALGYLVFQVPIASKVAKIQFGQDSGFGETGEWTAA